MRMTADEERKLRKIEKAIRELEAEGGPGPDTKRLWKKYEDLRADRAAQDRELQRLQDELERTKRGDYDPSLVFPEVKEYVAAEVAEIRQMIEPHVRRGVKTVRSAKKGGDEKKKVADWRHKMWQKDADTIWAEKPGYSRNHIAGILQDHYNGKPYDGLRSGRLREPDPRLTAKQQAIGKNIKKPA